MTLMRTPTAPLHRLPRLLVGLFFTGSLTPFSGPAQSVPTYAFSINSAQVPGGLSSPASLATDKAGNLYVSSLSTIVKLAPNGTFLARWGTNNSGSGQFAYPGPMAFDAETNLFVSDPANDRVDELDSTGTFLFSWGTNGTNSGQFDYPDGLAIDHQGRIYVSDQINSRIEVFSNAGNFLAAFTGASAPGGPLSFPSALAVDSSNYLYVVDSVDGYTNYRVLKLDNNGGYITEWQAHGTPTVNYSEIGGITADSSNNVYVADASNNRVQKYTSNGTFLGEWGSFGTGPGQFNSPMGIALSPSENYVYVSDWYNARIEVFAYSPEAPIIYLQPTNQSLSAGTTLTLAAGVFGAQPIALQWQMNGTNIPGATNLSFSIANVPLSASGSYTLVATNALGTSVSTAAIISVLPVVVQTLPAGGITSTGAVLNGSIITGGQASSAWFEWGTDTNYGAVFGLTNVSANTTVSLQAALDGLSSASVYHYRLVSSNELGAAYGDDVRFQVGLKPWVVTLAITAVNSNTVVLNATVNPNGRETHAWFRWGRSEPYGSSSPVYDVGAGINSVSIQAQATQLSPTAIYYVQPVATNDLGTSVGPQLAFVLPPWSVLNTPALYYDSLACTADGKRLFASAAGVAGLPATNVVPALSTNAGVTWKSLQVYNYAWQAVSMSADGSHLAGVTHYVGSSIGPIFYSTNSGLTWTSATGTVRSWSALATSGDGLKLAAAAPLENLVMTSTNAGVTWFTNRPPFVAAWNILASSADGRTLLVAAGSPASGPVFSSFDGGRSWSSNNLPVEHWKAVASSADGQVVAAAAANALPNGGLLYLSTNSGATWVPTALPPTNWQAFSISADGRALAGVVGQPGVVFVSRDLGATWQTYALPDSSNWAMATSADGATLYLAGGLNIYTLKLTFAPHLQLTRNASQSLLSWTVPSAQSHLQFSDGLISPAWLDVTNGPTLNPNTLQYQVQIPLSSPEGFYRLKQP